MIRHACIIAFLAFLTAPIAHAQVTLTATSDAHPSDTVTWEVNGAAPTANVVVLLSLRNQGMTFGPINTHCGTIEVQLGIGPGFRPVGRGQVMPDGTFSSSETLLSRLPARLDGLVLYSQAVTLDVARTPRPQSCSITPATSNVAATTLHIP